MAQHRPKPWRGREEWYQSQVSAIDTRIATHYTILHLTLDFTWLSTYTPPRRKWQPSFRCDLFIALWHIYADRLTRAACRIEIVPFNATKESNTDWIPLQFQSLASKPRNGICSTLKAHTNLQTAEFSHKQSKVSICLDRIKRSTLRTS